MHPSLSVYLNEARVNDQYGTIALRTGVDAFVTVVGNTVEQSGALFNKFSAVSRDLTDPRIVATYEEGFSNIRSMQRIATDLQRSLNELRVLLGQHVAHTDALDVIAQEIDSAVAP
jgi:hypothetical protein